MSLALACVAAAVLLPAASAGGATPQVPLLTDIRVGRQASFDRVVLDLDGRRPEFFIRSVDQLFYDGSGLPVVIDGNHFLQVTSTPAAAHDDSGNPSYHGPHQFTTPSLANVQAVAITGDFEGHLTVGLGMRDDSWHRVLVLDNPTRVVIDVGHN
ncbi:hypothetical protein GCM10010185_20050 [Saccharothrix coeruleofusca]|uniref:AMIN-like domain-containing protein n=1 Tax=Saccharothrix coeruleofusca TaxID=33919 RepID=A0A918EDH7_9PSEU|nr:hypothetical protein GCM10010185_20050 [Saccharothrix coeruleofusca]